MHTCIFTQTHIYKRNVIRTEGRVVDEKIKMKE